MNTREQLEELSKYLTQLLDEGGRRLTDQITVRQARRLVKQLIAERPYEPGEPVIHDGNPCYFYCVSPHNDDVYVVDSLQGGLAAVLASHVTRKPKTYRVKPVPEEVIDKAQRITASRIDDVAAANEVCNWLANPENWETDSGERE